MFRWLVFFLLSFTCVSAQAFKVEPMSAEMAPFGKRAQMSMRIENSSSDTLTVELYPLSMTMDEYGQETITAADEELLVIPVTAIIAPGRSQSVMVRYLGDPSITESKAYRVAIKQVAVERASQESGQVNFLLQFNTLINVRPQNTSPQLAIKSVKKSDNNKWLLEILNTGDSYGRLTKTNWRVTDGTHSTYLKGTDIAKRIPGTLILPNSTRYLEMLPLDDFNVQSLSIQIDQEL